MTGDRFTCEQVANAALGAPKREAAELLYRCPRHDDEHPSLSVNPAKDCWLCGPCIKAGNAWELAAHLGGLDLNDKPGITAWLRERGLLNGHDSARMAPVASYVYRDENGEPLFRTVRYKTPSGKTFRQFRADGKGGWLPGLNGTRLVPYRLNEWGGREWVCIVEGEKCADALWDTGIPATSNAAGAGKWRPEYNVHFHGKGVALLPDHDTPGESHVRDVAHQLFPVAKAVKVIRLPNLPDKGDVADWLAAGGTREKLLDLIAQAPALAAADVAKPEPKKSGGFNLVSMRELLAEPEETVAWLLLDRLPAGGFSILAGKPKAGKSTLARCLALAVAAGGPFMGWETDRGPVIYLALEEKRSEVRSHFKAMGAGGEEPIFIHAAQAPQDAIPALREIVKEHKPKLIIVDPLLKLARLRSEKEYAEVSGALEPLLALARESGAHLLAVYHSPKVDRADLIDSPIGSTAFSAAVDTLLVLKRNDRYRTLATVQRYGPDLPETVLAFDPDSRNLSLGAERAEAEEQRIAVAMLEYLTGCPEPQTEPEIMDGVDGKTTLKRAALRGLVKAGKLRRDGKGSKGNPFSYSCSLYTAGTREQESQNATEPPVNKGPILVPDVPPEGPESDKSGEQAFSLGDEIDYLEL